MSQHAWAAARKFWEVFPAVMRTIFAEARRGSNNLTPSHFRVLHVLSAQDCSISQLAQHQDVSLPSMSETVQTLVERGWLERSTSAADRRVMHIGLTRKGQQVLVNEHKRLVGLMANRLGRLTSHELTQVEQGFALLLDLFDDPQAHPVAKRKVATNREA
ncbi:MAG TPA: MarR family transcriptional regulator [Anaerolineales bacterium]|nr:MarR family transcriptional regulator [Anaerolineales bacterium]